MKASINLLEVEDVDLTIECRREEEGEVMRKWGKEVT